MGPRRRRADLRAVWPLLWGGLLLTAALLLPARPGAQAPADAGPADADTSAPAGDVRVRAERVVYRVLDGERVTFLYGNVVIRRDTLTAYADSARHYPDRDVFELYGDVRLLRRASTLTARRAVYDRPRGTADFYGGVRVTEGDVIGTSRRGETRREGRLLRLIGEARLTAPDYVVWADTIVQDRLERTGEAFGDVRIVDPEARTLVTGEHASFSRDGEVAVVDRRPDLTTREEGREALEATARVMHFYRPDERVVMVDSVRIRQGRTRARADTATAYGRDRLLLRGSPAVEVADQSVMTARSIEFLYRRNQLQRILLHGDALIEDASPDSLAGLFAGLPRLDRLSGDTIVVDLEDEEVRRSTVYGAARSLYVPTDLEDEVAFNDVSGDTITIFFRDQRVQRVQVKGQMSGVYTYARRQDLEPVPGPPPVETEGGPVPPAPGAGAAGPAPADTADTGADDPAGPAAPPASGAATADSLAAALAARAEAAAAADTFVVAALDTARRGGRPGAAGPPLDFEAGAEEVRYSGRAVTFRLDERTIELEGEAGLEYGTMTLTAQHIRMNTTDRELYAWGEPLLVDGNQKIAGELMGYNFAYKTGAVRHGMTTFDRNFYEGDEIRRYADGSLKILSGRMTACDLAEPHYHFWSQKMKIKLRDKVVARPVVLKIGHVPLFAVPFYFKSLKEGRRSGILFPNFNFGWSSRTGRYIRDFGYYWAASDYYDFILEGDYNERQQFTYRLTGRYVKRYGFEGSLTYARKLFLGPQSGSREWQLNWRHSQPQFLDEYRLGAEVRMASRTLSTNNLSTDVGRAVVNGQLHSTLSLSRSWSAVGVSLGLTRDEYPNAADDDPVSNETIYTQTLPSLRLTFSRQTLMSERAARGGGLLPTLLSATYFSQGYTFNSGRTRREETVTDTQRATGTWSLDVRPDRLGIFSFNTGVRGNQAWSRTATDGRLYALDEDSVLVSRPVDEVVETTSPSLSINSGLGTTLYGIFPLGIGPLQAMRHTMSLSVGHSYQPALGSKQEQGQNFSFTLQNRFDLKLAHRTEADSLVERNLDGLLDWSLSASYDPDSPVDQRWSTISSSLTISPSQNRNFDLKVYNSIDPYSWSLLSTRLTYGLNLSGRFDIGERPPEAESQRNQLIERLGVPADSTVGAEGVAPLQDLGQSQEDFYEGTLPGEERPGTGPGGGETGGGRFLPWRLSTSISVDRDNVRDTATARGNLTLSTSLSENWDFAYRSSFNFTSGQMLSQSWNLRRDLHCWALEFNRTIYPNDSEFGFRLYLKSIPAVKVTRGKEDLLGTASSLGAGGIF